MTDKLYCPVCEYELRQVGATHMCMEFSCCLCGMPIATDCMKELCKKFDVLQKKLGRLTIAAQRCLNKFAHERIHAELKAALKECEDIRE